MNKISKKSWIEIGVCAAIFVAIAIVTAFFDLQINKALDNTNSLFGQYFANLGELPTYLAAPIIGAILFYQSFGKSSKQRLFFNKICGASLTFIGYAAALYMWFWDNFVAEELMYDIVYVIVFAAFMSLLTIAAFGAVPKDVIKKLFWFALFLGVVAIASNVISIVMKLIWARQRYRTMTIGNPQTPEALFELYPNYNYDGFTPWYMINTIIKPEIRTEEYKALFEGLSSPFQSFPSGHTAAASVSFALIIVPELFPKFKKIKWVFWTVPAVYTALVAVSRVVATAHYLSDTLFGYYIGLCVATLARWIFVSKIKVFKEEPACCCCCQKEEVAEITEA